MAQIEAKLNRYYDELKLPNDELKTTNDQLKES